MFFINYLTSKFKQLLLLAPVLSHILSALLFLFFLHFYLYVVFNLNLKKQTKELVMYLFTHILTVHSTFTLSNSCLLQSPSIELPTMEAINIFIVLLSFLISPFYLVLLFNSLFICLG